MRSILNDIGERYNTDKATKQVKLDPKTGASRSCLGHDYLRKYEKLFLPNRSDPVNFLEIGCCGSAWRNAAGTRSFLEYFSSPNSVFWGLDIKPIIKDLVDIDPRFQYKQTDCGKTGFMSSIPDIKFDVIIEDGSHFWEHQSLACAECIPRLKPGGVLIIEDVHTSFLDPAKYGQGADDDFVTKAVGASINLLSNRDHKMKQFLASALQGFSPNQVCAISFIRSAIVFTKEWVSD